MKRIANRIATGVMALLLISNYAAGQVKSDFSDWNVPPPLPPGTLPKIAGSYTSNTTTVLVLIPPADIPSPNLTNLPVGKLETLSAVPGLPPYVASPSLPDMMQTATISDGSLPIPVEPVTPALPGKTPQDNIGTVSLDMPSPPSPDMPSLPPMPDTTGKFGNVPVVIPLTPYILRQPDAAPSADYATTEWPVPPIPLTVSNVITVHRKIHTGNKDKRKINKNRSLF